MNKESKQKRQSLASIIRETEQILADWRHYYEHHGQAERYRYAAVPPHYRPADYEVITRRITVITKELSEV